VLKQRTTAHQTDQKAPNWFFQTTLLENLSAKSGDCQEQNTLRTPVGQPARPAPGTADEWRGTPLMRYHGNPPGLNPSKAGDG
jgi:hypothetical protein